MKRIPIDVTNQEKADLKEALETLRPHVKRRGQVTDFFVPAMINFINAAKQDRAIEFIEYIKAWR